MQTQTETATTKPKRPRLPNSKGDPRTSLISRRWKKPTSLTPIINKGPSPTGWHSFMSNAACFEKVRLSRLGMRKESYEGYNFDDSLHAMTFGSVWHILMEAHSHGRDAIEILHGIDGIPPISMEKLETMFLIYKQMYSVEFGFRTIGIEAEIEVPIPGTDRWFTVRYDKVILSPNGRVILMEHKTAARFSAQTMTQWQTDGQIISQVWAWSQHPLSKIFGPVYHTIMDIATKTKDPQFYREPVHVTNGQVERMGEDLREQTLILDEHEKTYGMDSPWPRSYACWTRYGPCQFLEYCHHEAQNAYVKIKRKK